MSKIILRPSSIDNFLQCPQQWKRVFLDKESSIPGNRAAIGTAIHAAAEVLWVDAMETGVKDTNETKLKDAAIEAYQEEVKKGVSFDVGEDQKSSEKEVLGGTTAYVEDLAPFVEIPTGVERRYTVNIEHPVVEAISGTVDYIDETRGVIDDIKTSKRKPTVSNYETQQSTYRLLAKANGVDIKEQRIQGVVFKKDEVTGTLLDAAINENRARGAINTILRTLTVYDSGVVDPDILFRGNPKYYLCSAKYCAFYSDCKFAQGE